MSASKEKNEILASAIKKLSNQELQALDVIYEEMAADVYALALTKTDDETQAKNAMEEVFVLVYKYACRYKKEINPYKWIMNIANNLTNRKFKSDVRLFKAMRSIKKADEVEIPDVIDSAKASCQAISQDMETLDYFRVMTDNEIIIIHIIIAAIAVLAFIIGIAVGKPNQPKLAKDIDATVYVDAASSYTLTVNEDELILDYTAYDEASEEALMGLDLVGTSLEDSLKYLAGTMYMNGELNGDDATILVSVDAVSDDAEDEVFTEISKVFDEDSYDFSAILQRVDAEGLNDAAKSYDISVGKMGFVSLIIKASDEYTGDNAKELSEKTIDELAAIYRSLSVDDAESVDEAKEETSEEKEEASTDEEAEDEKSDESVSEEKKADSNGIVVFIKDKATTAVEEATESATEAAKDAVDNAVENVKDKAEDAVTDAATDVAEDIAKQAGADDGAISEVKTYIKKIFARIFD